MNLSQSVIKFAFRQRYYEVREDIESGRITFYNPPEHWEKKILNITALNCLLLILAAEAKWN